MHSETTPSVLVVEDERVVAMDLQQSLAEMGYDAFAIASSGDEALGRASERCPDIVLMDIRIKGCRDGIDTAELLRERFSVPIVYLTAHADDATIQRAKKTEPFGYLIKPVKSAELSSVIEVSLYKHKIEKQLRERERWFSTTLQSIADAVITVDLSGKVTFMNGVAEQLTGSKLEVALGRSSSEVVQLLEPSCPSPLDRVLVEKKPITIHEATLERSDRTTRIISDSAAPVLGQGQMLGAVMVFRDITDRKLLEKRLELADRLASLGTMAAGIAHEVNNPLAVVVANASLVLDEMGRSLVELRSSRAASEGTIRKLEEILQAQVEIQSAATRIERIVGELRTFSRPPEHATGRADVARTIDFAIRTTAHELRHRARTVIDVADVPAVAIDETKLGQVLINLLLNAAHALPPGEAEHNQITVTARRVGDTQVSIDVRDTGSGMASDVLGRIFEPFFTTKPVGEGTGLGLSICHGLVTSVGGEIRADSRVGEGSVFHVDLPLARNGTNDTTLVPPSSVERRGRILVIDDEDLVLRVIARVLKNHELACVQSARDGLALLRSGREFDVILSDVMMPNMTGIELYEDLLRSRPDASRRVVFLTGGAVNTRIAEYLRALPNFHVEKPFSPEELRTVVQQLLAASDAPLSSAHG